MIAFAFAAAVVPWLSGDTVPLNEIDNVMNTSPEESKQELQETFGASLFIFVAVMTVGELAYGASCYFGLQNNSGNALSIPSLPKPPNGQINPRTGNITSYTLRTPTIFYRHWNTEMGNEQGVWVADIQLNSASVAQNVFSIPNPVNRISSVIIPAGSRIQQSLATPILGLDGLGTQYELLMTWEELVRLFWTNIGPLGK